MNDIIRAKARGETFVFGDLTVGGGVEGDAAPAPTSGFDGGVTGRPPEPPTRDANALLRAQALGYDPEDDRPSLKDTPPARGVI